MKATETTVRIFGGLMGLAGIEHGVGEILQGSRAPQGIFILSWPDSPFFRIMGGEPALTVVPNLLITGILAVLFSAAYLLCAVLYTRRQSSGRALMLLSIPMLLAGAGIFPPVLGLLIGAAAGRSSCGPAWWAKILPNRAHQNFGTAWPVLIIICMAAWLLMFPGLNILSHFFGVTDDTLMLILLAAALVSLKLTFLAAWSHDAVQSGTAKPRPDTAGSTRLVV